MKKRPIIFDCDPGHDDAIALVMALACPDWDIRAITTVGGNNTIQNVTNNALRILEVTGRTEIPVASGQAAPFLRELVQTGKVHGRTGMDGHSLPAPTITPVSEDAVGLMADILEKSETPVTLLVTGVFTNIATLLLSYPHLKQKISEISIMGGSYYRGNWSPVAEFNVWADPEAADVVMRAGIPFTLYGLDVTHQAYLRRDEYAALRTYQNPVADFIADLFDFFSKSCIEDRGHPGCLVHDACAVAGLMDPSLFRYMDTSAHMDLDGGITRGGCVIELRPQGWPRKEEVNAKVATWVDRPRFTRLLLDLCASYTHPQKGAGHEA